MSGMGFFPGEWDNGQFGFNTPIDVRQRLALALMGNQGNQGMGGGLANAGSSILGALALRDAQDNAANQAYQNRPASSFPSSSTPYGDISSKLPALPKQSWLGNLFSLGGST